MSMYMTDELTSLSTVSERDTFFQDLRAIESLVKDSLLVYVAYELKAQDAANYLADPKQKSPLLEKEATLRGITIEALATLVLAKGKAFKDGVKRAELLRTEFNIVYPTLTTYEDKLALRDRLLKEFKDLAASLPS